MIRPVDVTPRTGKVVLLDFTDAMKEAMRRNGKRVPNQHHGGLVHSYWKSKLKEFLQAKGWSVTIEKPIGNGQRIDLHAVKPNTSVAIEVETGDRGARNVKKLLRHNDDWILVFCATDSVKTKTRNTLKSVGISANHILLLTPADYERKALTALFQSQKSTDTGSSEST